MSDISSIHVYLVNIRSIWSNHPVSKQFISRKKTRHYIWRKKSRCNMHKYDTYKPTKRICRGLKLPKKYKTWTLACFDEILEVLQLQWKYLCRQADRYLDRQWVGCPSLVDPLLIMTPLSCQLSSQKWCTLQPLRCCCCCCCCCCVIFFFGVWFFQS